jgi:prepilin-type N-terminal cleavage/methylation domain-containing protein
MKRASRGFTLIEILMVLVLVGIMLRVALPFFRTATNKSSVRGAMDAIASMHARAKGVAVQRGRIAGMIMDASSGKVYVVVRNTGATAWDTVGRVENMQSRFGVTFTTTQNAIAFSPRGIGADVAATTIIISKSGFSDTLVSSVGGRLIR